MQDESIFKLIYPKDNDELSEMKPKDRKELLNRLRRYSLTLRNSIGLAEDETFGLELEFQHKEETSSDNIENMMRDNDLFKQGWVLKPERTVWNGAEINTPIATDTPTFWNKLDFVCNELQKDAKVTELCGGHNHIGQQILGSNKESLLNFADLWVAYEPVIYRFGSGENAEVRPRAFHWAGPLARKWGEELQQPDFRKQSKEDILKGLINCCFFPTVRLTSFEFQDVPKIEEDNTIEFRCPDATLDSVIWQNNVNLFTKLVECAKNGKFDRELLEDVRISTVRYAGSFDQYNAVHLNEALVFADMIFNNNLDKIYFLKQYFKDTEKGKSIVLKK